MEEVERRSAKIDADSRNRPREIAAELHARAIAVLVGPDEVEWHASAVCRAPRWALDDDAEGNVRLLADVYRPHAGAVYAKRRDGIRSALL